MTSKIKKCLAITALIMLAALSESMAQSIYTQPLMNMNGSRVNLQAYAGIKLMLVIVPVTPSDSLVNSLAAFINDNSNRVRVIGILSEEDGYGVSMKDTVKHLYKGVNIVLTEPLKTKKGGNQSPIMQWLTDKTKNQHFDMDAKGVGHKYFINEAGTLYAVIRPGIPLNAPAISRIINAPVASH